jgi:hypothetical protein
MIRKVACNYTILRFLPYADSGEFVNLGIALACPELHWFGYQLETRRLDRVTHFFPELKQTKNTFVEGCKLFHAELQRIDQLLKEKKDGTPLQSKADAQFFNDVFLNLVRPREEVFCFSQPRTILTEQPQGELNRLFAVHVERGFSQQAEPQKIA